MGADLSVVIPSHSRPDLLHACLAGVARHAPAGTEVLVVDDGSPGAAVSAAARDFAGVRVLRSERRRGFCAAANAGAAAARGAVVELLNDDAEVTAGWADAPLAAFRDAAVGAVAPLVLRWPGGGAGQAPVVDSAGDRYFLGGVAGKRGHGRRLGAEHLRPGRVFGASASSAFYRRADLLRVGGFPESFGAYFEDVDLAFRLHRIGRAVLFEPASRVLHRVSASYGRPCRRLLEQQSRNDELVFWRNVPRHALPRALPLHAAVLAGKAWRRWRHGGLAAFAFGRLRALGEALAVGRHRAWLEGLGQAASWEDWQVESRYWGPGPERMASGEY